MNSILNNEFIVFCTDHYNPLGMIRSLGEKGIEPIVVLINYRRGLISKCKYIKKLHKVDAIEEGYQLILSQYGSYMEKKPYLLTADDKITSYLDHHFDELKDKFVFFNAGERDRISYYMNKFHINQLAEKHGLKVLNSVVVDKGDVPSDLEYPVITKSIASTVGGWKDDVFICKSPEELKEAFNKIKSPQVLLQKYIVKKNELCLDGFSVNGGSDVFISIASNYTYILPGAYSNAMILKNFKDQDLKQRIDAMFAEIGFEGIFSMEFLIDENDQLYFCEINFRNSTWSYASTSVGMNLPFLWAQSMHNKGIINGIYREIPKGYTAIVEFEDYKVRVKSGEMNVIKWLKELLHADCVFYYNKKDMLPFFSVFTGKIRRLFRKE